MNENLINVTITENALKRVSTLLLNKEKGTKFRISVAGGGCSGFKYEYQFVEEKNEDDVEIFEGGITILIDKLSLDDFMQGAIVDYVEELGNSYFDIKNPNSSSRCGCGNSFSI